MATSENENDKSIRCETHPGITLTANGTCRACNREAKQQRLHEKMVAAGAAPLKLGAQRIAECHAAYDQAKADIANLLGWLECELAKDTNKGWSQIGNLHKVRSDLIDTLAFLSNSEPEQIKEAMEDAREAGKK